MTNERQEITETLQKMGDPIQHLRVLHNNPFIFSSAIAAFFGSLGEKEQALLLGYLVLPITLHLPSRKYLGKARANSSLRTMLQDRSRLYGLDERVGRYREMSNATLQYLLSIGGISVNELLVVTIAEQQPMDGPTPEGMIKAARQLGNFFSPYDVPTVFRMLGVMSL
ncbi:MAG: hypothetical protein A2061_10005 [Gallionellales bacterium GWA2_59_43]|nr:MAG: hypothetical protein A2061_10005 [Gallionellales bacterium GWA2_59_43]